MRSSGTLNAPVKVEIIMTSADGRRHITEIHQPREAALSIEVPEQPILPGDPDWDPGSMLVQYRRGEPLFTLTVRGVTVPADPTEACVMCGGSGTMSSCRGGACSHVNDREYPCPNHETERELGPEPAEVTP